MKRGIHSQKVLRCADCGALWTVPARLTGKTRCPSCACTSHVGSATATDARGASEARPGSRARAELRVEPPKRKGDS